MAISLKTCVQLAVSTVFLSTLASGQQRIVACYFTNWAQYRPSIAKFDPINVDPKLCTHLYFAFAFIDPDNTTINPIEWNDLTVLYPGIMALKRINPQLKIILSVGGYSEMESSWIAVSNVIKVTNFARNVITYLRQYGFDGVDVDWETPSAITAAGFITLVQTMRREIDNEIVPRGQQRLLLSIDVVANRNTVQYYTPSALAQSMDIVNVMAYDFYGEWEPFLGHHSPLFLSNHDRLDPARNFYSQAQAIEMWERAGVPTRKLVLGFAAYARAFKMIRLDLNKPGDPYNGAPAAAPYTGAQGIYAYFEVCRKSSEGWTEVYMQESRVPYVYGTDVRNNEPVWIGYDNVQSFTEKAMFVVQKGLAGAMMWDLSFDDFTGQQCGQGPYPLLRAINDVFEKTKCTVDSDCADVLAQGICQEGTCTCPVQIVITPDNRYKCVGDTAEVDESSDSYADTTEADESFSDAGQALVYSSLLLVVNSFICWVLKSLS